MKIHINEGSHQARNQGGRSPP